MGVRTQCAVAVLLAGVAAAPAAAQGALRLTVEDAVARGVAAAPRLAEARAQEVAAQATIAAREALARPGVSASSGYLRTNHVDIFGIPQPDGSLRVIFPDIPDNVQLHAEVDVPVYTAGRVDALVRSATADARAAEADRHTTADDVRLGVVTAYWTLVMARDRVGVLQRGLERADAQVADVRSRVDAGVLPPNDLLSSQAQRARQNVQLIQARNDAALAESQLDRLIGVPPDQPIETTSPVDEPSAVGADLATQTAATLTARATEQRAERQSLVSRQAAVSASGDAAIAALRPQIAALASVQPARPNQLFVPRQDVWHTSWNLGVNVTWSLWDGGRAKAEHAASVAQADAIGQRMRDFDQGLAVEVRARMFDIQSTRAAIAASNEAVAAATEARRVVGERFAAGVATSTDVLEADVAQLEAELERTQLTATLRIDEARLTRAVGAQ
jgi:outer membrane protein TolC